MSSIDPEDLITISAASEEKNCSRTTLYRAISDGRLNGIEVGDRQMLVKNETFEAFEPKWKGARVQRMKEKDGGTEPNSQ